MRQKSRIMQHVKSEAISIKMENDGKVVSSRCGFDVMRRQTATATRAETAALDV
jgi:hypothetical protein